MARKESLLRLQQSLTQRRDELRRRLGMELAQLEHMTSGDTAEQAFDSTGEELATQLADIESRELAQIERALRTLKHGKYGTCELCAKKIPTARLEVLPYSTVCIKCQREIERHSDGDGQWKHDFSRINEREHFHDNVNIRVVDLEMEMR